MNSCGFYYPCGEIPLGFIEERYGFFSTWQTVVPPLVQVLSRMLCLGRLSNPFFMLSNPFFMLSNPFFMLSNPLFMLSNPLFMLSNPFFIYLLRICYRCQGMRNRASIICKNCKILRLSPMKWRKIPHFLQFLQITVIEFHPTRHTPIFLIYKYIKIIFYISPYAR